jgi:hypothetical protein
MTSNVKRYLSCIDSALDVHQAEALTQSIQHLAISTFAESLGGKVTFYTGEDILTHDSQSLMRSTIAAKPEIEGVIFFRIRQFLNGDRLSFTFMREILTAGYELHFAREMLSMFEIEDLQHQFSLLYCFEVIANGTGSYPEQR